ncbi:hypothetical protein JEQ12_001862 [Ovis aries]|uniref:Uncharacterized protein n=1 Tax=Ovis aries TaxID=9940 RepID=A0A836AR39_SHEEP|nr:hypothetical protein JEQ12_001862 [Ovis aries]
MALHLVGFTDTAQRLSSEQMDRTLAVANGTICKEQASLAVGNLPLELRGRAERLFITGYMAPGLPRGLECAEWTVTQSPPKCSVQKGRHHPKQKTCGQGSEEGTLFGEMLSKETSKFQKLRILPPAAASPSSPGPHCQAPKGCSLLDISQWGLPERALTGHLRGAICPKPQKCGSEADRPTTVPMELRSFEEGNSEPSEYAAHAG